MAKDSRLAEIYRQELKDKGLLSALISASSERRKEKMDVRNLLPSTGLTGVAFQKVFGRAYRYGSKKDSVRDISSGMESKSLDNKITRIGIDTKITAKNSIVLPGMARDMNVMRQNMQQMVRLNGGKAAKGADALFKRSGQRNALYKSLTTTKETDKPEEKESGGLLSTLGGMGGGILGGLGSIGGGLLSLGGSILGGIGSLVGGAAKGIFGIISSVLSGMGPLGIILAAGAGYLIYQMSQTFDFEKMSGDFKNIYEDVTKSIKNFLGLKEGEEGIIGSVSDVIGKGINILTAGALAAYGLMTDTLKAHLLDSVNYVKNFFKQNEDKMIMGGALMGAALLGGPKTVALALGGLGLYLAGKDKFSETDRTIREENAMKGMSDILKKYKGQTPEERKIDLETKARNEVLGAGDDLMEYNKFKGDLQQVQRDRADANTFLPTDNASKVPGFSERYNSYLGQMNTSAPTRVASGSYADRISASESGGDYNATNLGVKQINGKPVSQNSIAEVVEWQKQNKASNRHAAGKYQFINVASAAQLAGLSGSDMFSPRNQEKMFQAFTHSNKQQLAALGLPTTNDYLAMAHAVGAQGTKDLISAQRTGSGGERATNVLGLEGTASSTNPHLQGTVDSVISRYLSSPTMVARTPLSGNAVTPSSSQMESIMSSMAAATRQLSEAVFNKEMQQAAASPVFKGGQMPGAPQVKANPYSEDMLYQSIVRFNTLG